LPSSSLLKINDDSGLPEIEEAKKRVVDQTGQRYSKLFNFKWLLSLFIKQKFSCIYYLTRMLLFDSHPSQGMKAIFWFIIVLLILMLSDS